MGKGSPLIKDPSISIVVPNLNEEKYLWKFLVSLAHQSWKDFEIIIVDGGSTDRSRQIVNDFDKAFPEIPVTKIIDERRNIGAVRNRGSAAARGDLLFHTSSDVILDPWILSRVNYFFWKDPGLVSLTARTKPVSSMVLPHLAYQGFDLLRWLFSRLPGTLRKYRPGGNFLVIRKDVFWRLGGFPEVCINEDGLLGQRIDELLIGSNIGSMCAMKVKFDLGMCVHHHIKRFEERGSLKTLLFYVYVFANLFPMMKPLLYKIESNSAEIFKNRSDLRRFK